MMTPSSTTSSYKIEKCKLGLWSGDLLEHSLNPNQALAQAFTIALVHAEHSLVEPLPMAKALIFFHAPCKACMYLVSLQLGEQSGVIPPIAASFGTTSLHLFCSLSYLCNWIASTLLS